MRRKTIETFVRFHFREKNDLTILTATVANPSGYGRIIKRGKYVVAVREELDANAREKKIKKINSGCYIFTAPEIFKLLKKIRKNPLKGEYYLTDIIEIAAKSGLKIGEFSAPNPKEVSGVNTKRQLAEINKNSGRKL